MLTVAYTDGQVIEGQFADWPTWRADGVDEVRVMAKRGYTALSGHSVYWLYREGDAWVAGSGSVGSSLAPEVIVHPDGRHEARRIEYMPDLPHNLVKLGWWK